MGEVVIAQGVCGVPIPGDVPGPGGMALRDVVGGHGGGGLVDGPDDLSGLSQP